MSADWQNMHIIPVSIPEDLFDYLMDKFGYDLDKVEQFLSAKLTEVLKEDE